MNKTINTGTDHLLANFNEGIITLTLNNPKFKNALSEKLTPYLRKILKKIKEDSKYKLLVIRGAGDSFCSGGNIKGMNVEKNKTISVTSKINDLVEKQNTLTGLLYSLNIPTIAIITGAAAGAGFSIALSCDLRIGNSNSFFVSNYSKIGLSGDYGISLFLTKLLGESKAKEIMFLNKRIYADEALNLGLLNLLYKKNFEKKIKEVCKEIISLSPLALKHIKKNIQLASQNSLTASLKQEAKNLINCSNSKEHKMAVLNFRKK
ncbi:MAG: Short-chain-enoyl-CoA hydratase [Alphaproteobacteria bacterium MarineAlpha9_Bin4]|nr:enoyl-CoA hydratase [Pelagibacterales bacterium]PPR26323.1 MAG: Short-chain-enoyl-CoA hydratase [Alphaproteobacteria bacterium MarineAlpha9_Bin4]|tara:strand:- start:3293 stop:4081 length:789 start_codon:yes stop_codon:yes gene_type:complete